MDTTIYVVMMGGYFIVMLLIGVFLGRGASTSQIDFFLAKDKLPASAIGFSYSTTQISWSSYLGTVGTINARGYTYLPGMVAGALASWIAFALVGERVRKVASRFECVTLADIYEKRFGKSAGIIATIIMLIGMIPLITAQLKAAGSSFQVILGIPYLCGIVIFGVVTIIYTSMGGMFAVAWTDLVQGVLMLLGVFIILPVLLAHVEGFTALNKAIAVKRPDISTFSSGVKPLIWIVSGLLTWSFYSFAGTPASVTRFLSTSDERKLKFSLIWSVSFSSIIFIGISVIGLCGVLLLPELKTRDLAFPMLIKTYLHPALGGVVLAAVLGAMMSTLDSALLMSSSLFTHNI